MIKLNTVGIGVLGSAVLLASTSPLMAADKSERPRAEIFQRLVDCRQIADENARLACYDQQVATLELAEQRKEIFLVDKKQVQKTRRTLFGLPIPNLGLFGGGDKDDDTGQEGQLSEIEAVVKSASTNGGGWLITIDEGSAWQQIDSTPLALAPKPGMPVLIKRGALGSYKMSIRKQPPIKVKRII
jgi:hypothetical protein